MCKIGHVPLLIAQIPPNLPSCFLQVLPLHVGPFTAESAHSGNTKTLPLLKSVLVDNELFTTSNNSSVPLATANTLLAAQVD